MYLLGIDLGTTGCKSIIFSTSGEIIADEYIEYPLINKAKNHIEQDADLWWMLVKKATKEAFAKSGVDKDDIAALSISSQGISFVPVDKDGKVLANAISWLDTRADEQVQYLREKFREVEIYQRTGKRLNPAYTFPKILWVKEKMPELYNQTHKFLMGLDFLTYRLTGKFITDHSMASGTLAYNIIQKTWDKEILSEYEVDEKVLPEIGFPGTPISFILPEIADEMGLSTGTLVVLGAQDQKCAAIGSGIKKGVCTVSLGTATAVSTICEQALLDERMRIPCFTFDAKSWILESVISTSGVSLKWLKNTLYSDKEYGEMDAMIEKASPGSGDLFFYPHLEGAASPYWDSSARGLIYGISLATSSEEILRSLYEGIAYQIRVNIEIHEEIAAEIHEIRVFGGGAKSDIWCKIVADITGKEVKTLYTAETANLGAAIMAGIGCGIYKDYEEALERINLINKCYRPDVGNKEIYDRCFLKYKEIQDRILKY